MMIVCFTNLMHKFFILIHLLHSSTFSLFLNINQLDAINFIISLFSSLYMFRAHVLIVRGAKLYITVSGIITPIVGRPVRRLREDWRECLSIQSSLNLCTGRPPIGVMIPETVIYNFALLTMSTCARNM